MKNELISKERVFFLVSAIFVYVGIAISVSLFLNPGGIDWIQTYRPATLAALSLHSPYTIEIFHSPPWTIIPLIPFALFPERIGYGLLFCTGMISTGYVAYRRGAKPFTIAAVVLSYPVLFSNIYGNIDWLVYLGLLFPPRWGLFFILIKPQAGIGIAVFWLVACYRNGGFKQVIRDFMPVTLAVIVSFIVFGLWPLSGFSEIGKNFDASFWPQSIPIGMVLFVTALRTDKPGLALASSPFLSPYVAPSSFGAAVIGLLPLELETITAVIGIWILRIYSGHFLNN